MIEKFGGPAQKAWWEQHWFHALLIFASAIPLLYPTVPPLVDLPGHMGRYRVELDQLDHLRTNPYYVFQWQLIGNLGIDLLIIPVAKIFGLEFGLKLITIAIPTLTVTGLLWIAREVHGRVTPTVLFALPLAYGHPFMFGFINYTLSMALALCGFALWLRFERLRAYRTRAIVFLIFSPMLWVCHIYGWAALCLLCASSEIVHQHDRRGKWLPAFGYAALNGLSLAPPLLLMIMWRSGHVGGQTGGWLISHDRGGWHSLWAIKLAWYDETLRDQWRAFDAFSVSFLSMLIFVAIRNPWFSFSRNLAASALILLFVYLAVPYVVFGSAYADMRLTPYVFAIAIVGIRMRPKASHRVRTVLAVLGLIFFAARTAGTTTSFYRLANGANSALGALEHVPEGARLVSFVGRECHTQWYTNRLEHLPAMAIVRRHAFSNDQWEMAGAQLMRSAYPQGPLIVQHFGRDPSQMVTQPDCKSELWHTLNWALTNLPRDKFDYVWIINPPPYDPSLLRGMTQVWADGPNRLFRIDDHQALNLGHAKDTAP